MIASPSNGIAEDLAGHPEEMSIAPLAKDPSFWGITATQFLGAFNDNVFKQIVMLIFVAIPIDGGKPQDLQWLATAVFAAPWVLFSGLAGFLSDKYRKRTVIVLSKIAEILVMAAGIAAFFYYRSAGFSRGFVIFLSSVLFLMGIQSTFFGPGKYGILPGLFRPRDLPAVNGVILMTTFLAIIFGTALAGILLDAFGQAMWIPGLVCVTIAVVGTGTSLLLRQGPPAAPQLKLHLSSFAVPKEVADLMRRDRPLLAALVTSCLFWATGALVQPAVNALGKHQLQLPTNLQISLLVTVIGIGVAAGSALCGVLSGGRLRWSILRGGAIGIVACLILLSITLPGGRHLLGYYGSMIVLAALGVFTGFFAVPLQVFMQSRPPNELKGRMMATQNLLNWIAIIGSAGLNWLFLRWIHAFQLPISTLFAMTSILMIVVVIGYRPKENYQVGS